MSAVVTDTQIEPNLPILTENRHINLLRTRLIADKMERKGTMRDETGRRFTCNVASRVAARWLKMSRISAVLSHTRTLSSNDFSRLRSCLVVTKEHFPVHQNRVSVNERDLTKSEGLPSTSCTKTSLLTGPYKRKFTQIMSSA